MAEQDFDINIKTVADLTGVRKAADAIEMLNQQAKKSQAGAAAVGGGGDVAGFAGSAVGVGTIISSLTTAVRLWERFEDEQDKIAEHMLKAQEHFRALGESIVEMQDAAISAARIGTEPLEQSLVRLQQEIIKLKTEQSLLDLPREGDEWKKLNADIGVNEGLLHKVTAAMQKQADQADRLAKEKEKAAEKEARSQESFLKAATTSADPQVQAALRNEEAARKAQAAGDEISAEQFRRSSQGIQRGFTGGESAEFNQLKAAMDKMNVTLDMILQTFR